MDVITLKPFKISDLPDYLKLLSLEYDYLETKTFVELAKLIRKEFKVNCTTADLEQYYEQDNFSEDYELESRKHENNIHF